MLIDRVTEEDAIELSELENSIFKENAFGPLTLRREIAAGWGLAAREEGLIVAYALVRVEGGITDLTRLGVETAHQHRGLGRTMLRAVMQHSSRPLILTVRKNNMPARHLYDSEGFQVVSWLPLHGSLVMRL